MQSTVAKRRQEFVMFLTSDQRVIALRLAARGHSGEDTADLSLPQPASPSPCGGCTSGNQLHVALVEMSAPDAIAQSRMMVCVMQQPSGWFSLCVLSKITDIIILSFKKTNVTILFRMLRR